VTPYGVLVKSVTNPFGTTMLSFVLPSRIAGARHFHLGARPANDDSLRNYWPKARLIVPVIDADEIKVWRLIKRSTMMLPELPANRPVPPVMI
jgi:hypothetical protein